MLDSLFFIDRTLPSRLKSDLQLTDEQVTRIRAAARNETARLSENESDSAGRTRTAGALAAETISAIIGVEKAARFADLVQARWHAAADGDESDAIPLATPDPSATLDPRGLPSSPSAAASPSPVSAAAPSAPYTAPLDTRVVVNAPAYRMDVFVNGAVVKSYKVGIGYPEFPLPTGMRKASSIIFNPTWTPPDEPWVHASKSVKAGQIVAAGDKLNPLGPVKIPIGSPSLIHGGKSPAKIGTFASHGCVGLTNRQVQDFTRVMARLAGLELSEAEMAAYEKTPTETKSIKLNRTIPVELRYETIVIEDGKLDIFRDVYDRGTNVTENLESALSTYGLSLTDLTEQERLQASVALELMTGSAPAKAAAPATDVEKAAAREKALVRAQLARQSKGKKVISLEIAALSGKGYPAPVNLDTGMPQPSPTVTPKTR
jgi:lipoprotein-anchoring transpeptidase ErfK/SrfK